MSHPSHALEGRAATPPRAAERVPDILFVTHRVPYPPDKGDRIRTYHLLQHLAQDAAVHLACPADEPPSMEAVEVLGRLCARVEIVPIGYRASRVRAAASLLAGGTATEGAFASHRLRSVIRGWARRVRFRAAVASSSGVARYLRVPELDGIPAVVDLVDVDSQKWLDYAAMGRDPRSWLHRLEGRRLRRLERSLPEWAHAVVLVSRAEADLYRGLGPSGPGEVVAVGNGVDLDYFRPMPDPDASSDCVFVGALDYRPNVDGVRWFAREVWPEVLRRRPGARLVLVGRRPALEVRQLAKLPGIALAGQVPDVRPHLAEAALAVVPLRVARGVQNKVLEALAVAKAVVASPQSVEGLGVVPGVHLWVAEDPRRWADAVGELLGDAGQRRRLGAAARAFVESQHRWDRCLDPFSQLVGVRADGDDEPGAPA